MKPIHAVLFAFATINPIVSLPAAADSVDQLALRRRAAEAVVWGMPAVNTDLMLQAAIRANGGNNQIIYWSRLSDWKNQTLTPNPDAIYLMPFINTKGVGPMVLEVPPADEGSITGSIDDIWQTALEDVGPAGVDKGKGGKYLILPPDYAGHVPDGYIALPASTFQSYALLRSILRTGNEADVANAVAYGKRVRLYPLAQADSPPETKYVDVADVTFDSTIPYDARFFESLNRVVQAEPWLPRDKVMIDMLRTVGIEKGKSFTAPNVDDFTAAARQAHHWLDDSLEKLLQFAYFPAGRWSVPGSPDFITAMSTNFADPNSYPVEARGRAYSMGFFSAKHLGAGQFYLMTLRDKDGNALDGAGTYRLHVPPNAPVSQYWSVTLYDRATHALIRGTPRASRSSQNPDLQANPDGSVDVYFGPTAPAGKQANWVPTKIGGQFEAMFRLYGPQKALFEKTWNLPDIEKVVALSGTSSSEGGNSGVSVTVDNFIRAESDRYFGNVVQQVGVGTFHHSRDPLPIDRQAVIRGNRDTLYSSAVFDLDVGPVTITLPDAGRRFMSMQTISEDQYTTTLYGSGTHVLDRDTVGTRYAMVGIRTLIDPKDPKDMREAHTLQDGIGVKQPSGPGRFEVPAWDQVSQSKVRDALLTLASTVTDTSRAFGAKDQVDPVQRLIGAASAWGANPPQDALYLNVVPSRNDGGTVYELTVEDVPVDGFWSVSVYNAEGYFQANPLDAYTLNNVTAQKGADGSVRIQFGGCDGKVANCLPTMDGWNYMVRLYRPRPEILHGLWKFPNAVPSTQ